MNDSVCEEGNQTGIEETMQNKNYFNKLNKKIMNIHQVWFALQCKLSEFYLKNEDTAVHTSYMAIR